MKCLIFLNKFEFDLNTLKNKILKYGKGINFNEEDKNLFVEADSLNLDEIIKFEEVKKICLLAEDWKKLDFRGLINDSLNAFEKKPTNTFAAQAKFLSKIPISAKSIYKKINSEFKKHNYKYEENPETIIYIEFKKENKQVLYRIFVSSIKLWNKNYAIDMDLSKFIVVLESPGTVVEISDFLRLCWIFRLHLYILNPTNNFDQLLENAKKITKGIDYENFKLEIVKEIPKGYLKIGFSKNATENEHSLNEILKKR